jgi:uncharacterized protein YjiS (DUF1127 family)
MATYGIAEDLSSFASARPGRWLIDQLVGFQRLVAKSRTLARLEQLDDRTLKDIGLSRSELPSVVFGDIDRRMRV